MIDVVRLLRAAFCRDAAGAFSGEGAAIAGGRWNVRGTRVAYAASSRSLAALETLVHIDRAVAPTDYVFALARLDERDVMTLDDPPADWRNPVRSASTIAAGQSFLIGKAALALAVPSVVIPQEFNYLVNPAHSRFPALDIAPAFEPFKFDARLFTA